MNYIFFILFLSILTIFGFLFFIFAVMVLQILERYIIYKRYAENRTILEMNMDLIYYKLYQEETFIHISNETHMTKDEIEELRLRFIKEVISISGPSVITDLENIHGNIESLVTMLSIYFNSRFNKEEVESAMASSENGEPSTRVPFDNISIKNAEKNRNNKYFI